MLPTNKSRCDINVNNHLGYLHKKFMNNWNPKKIVTKSIKLENYNTLPNVFIGYNVIPYDMANEVRNFIYSVKFDNTLEVLNDVTNKPKDSAHFVNPSSILDIYENRTSDTKEWIWEHYNYAFWRLTPLSLNAFMGSPIASFITVLENAIRATKFCDIDFSKLNKGTWVIQRIEKGNEIGIHNDHCGSRTVSFVYYLTPDDWSKNDGGGLCVLNTEQKKFIRINPNFNSIAMWKVNSDYSGLHYVEKVAAPNNKPRISLVGFFDLQ
jgi:hypothetical protein